MAASTQSRKLVLITGATGGIGKTTAIALAKAGTYDFALHYNSADLSTRETLAKSIKDASPENESQISFFQANMGDYDSVRRMYEDITDALGNPDILFNNAGSAAGHSPVANLGDVPIEIFEKTWRINTGSAILLTQLCLTAMEDRGWGRIIFCSSIAAFTGGVVGPHYASSKSALHGFIHWIGPRVAAKGVTVNGVAPALIGDTNMMGKAEDEETKKKAQSECPQHCVFGTVVLRANDVV